MVGRGKLQDIGVNRSRGGTATNNHSRTNSIQECEPRMLSDGIIQRRVYSPSKASPRPASVRSPVPTYYSSIREDREPVVVSNKSSQHRSYNHYQSTSHPVSPRPTRISPRNAPTSFEFPPGSVGAGVRSGARPRSRSLEMVAVGDIDCHYYDHVRSLVSPTPLSFQPSQPHFEVPPASPSKSKSAAPFEAPTPQVSNYGWRSEAVSDQDVSLVLQTEEEEDKTPVATTGAKDSGDEEEGRSSKQHSPLEEVQTSLRKSSSTFQEMLLEVGSQRASCDELRASLHLLAASSRPTSVLVSPLSDRVMGSALEEGTPREVVVTPQVAVGTVSRNLSCNFRGDSHDPSSSPPSHRPHGAVPGTPAGQPIQHTNPLEADPIQQSASRVAGLLAVARKSLFKDPCDSAARSSHRMLPPPKVEPQEAESPEDFIEQAEREYQSSRTSGGSGGSPIEQSTSFELPQSISPKQPQTPQEETVVGKQSVDDDDSFFERANNQRIAAAVKQEEPRGTATPKEIRAPASERPSFELPQPRGTVTPNEMLKRQSRAEEQDQEQDQEVSVVVGDELDEDSFFERANNQRIAAAVKQEAPRGTATPKEIRAPASERPSFELPQPRGTVTPNEMLKRQSRAEEQDGEEDMVGNNCDTMDEDSFMERAHFMRIEHEINAGHCQGRRTASPADVLSPVVTSESTVIAIETFFSPPPLFPPSGAVTELTPSNFDDTNHHERKESFSPVPERRTATYSVPKRNASFMKPTASSQARSTSRTPVPSPKRSPARSRVASIVSVGLRRERSPQSSQPSRVTSQRRVSPARVPRAAFERPPTGRPALRPPARSRSPFVNTSGVLHSQGGQGMHRSPARSISPAQYIARCQHRVRGGVDADSHCSERLDAFVDLYQKARLDIRQALVKHEVGRNLASTASGGSDGGKLPFNLIARTIQRQLGGAVSMQQASRAQLAVTEKLSSMVEDMHCMLVLSQHRLGTSTPGGDKENGASDQQQQQNGNNSSSSVLLTNLFPASLFAFHQPSNAAASSDYNSQCYYSDHGVKAVEEAKELVPFRELLALLDQLPSSVKQLA